MLVGYPPGGAVDVSARLLSQRMTEALGQSVIVENRPGADSNVASDLAAKSSPDGHTLVGGFKSEVQPRYDASVASSRRLRGVF